jgi:hypothetical protein
MLRGRSPWPFQKQSQLCYDVCLTALAAELVALMMDVAPTKPASNV